ncbi:hypothetical protein ACFWP3_03195 [Streptomyces sp. NPDC058525]|uniref:hypothetical protein n=1 Tax=Streptomyces sp. NPDC058525 TaxID=3346538 RepID=UPI0036580237
MLAIPGAGDTGHLTDNIAAGAGHLTGTDLTLPNRAHHTGRLPARRTPRVVALARH